MTTMQELERRALFVDLLLCPHDVSGNPRGLFLLRNAHGEIVATIDRDYAYSTVESLVGRRAKWRSGFTFDMKANRVRDFRAQFPAVNPHA